MSLSVLCAVHLMTMNSSSCNQLLPLLVLPCHPSQSSLRDEEKKNGYNDPRIWSQRTTLSKYKTQRRLSFVPRAHTSSSSSSAAASSSCNDAITGLQRIALSQWLTGEGFIGNYEFHLKGLAFHHPLQIAVLSSSCAPRLLSAIKTMVSVKLITLRAWWEPSSDDLLGWRYYIEREWKVSLLPPQSTK